MPVIASQLPEAERESLLANRALLRQTMNDIENLYRNTITREALGDLPPALTAEEDTLLDIFLACGSQLVASLNEEVVDS